MKYYYHSWSPNCRKCTALIDHLGIEAERQVVQLAKGEQMAPEFLAINPNGMVPTLVDGQRVLIRLGRRHLERGDLLLFRHVDDLAVHRLLGWTASPDGRSCLRTRGDGRPRNSSRRYTDAASGVWPRTAGGRGAIEAPGLKVVSPLSLTAVVTNNRSPQITGLEWARPGMRVFQRIFSPVSPFQDAGKLWPSATPEADGPRNDGQ